MECRESRGEEVGGEEGSKESKDDDCCEEERLEWVEGEVVKTLEVGIGTGLEEVGWKNGTRKEGRKRRRDERSQHGKAESCKKVTNKGGLELTQLNRISFLRPERPLYSSSGDLSALHSE